MKKALPYSTKVLKGSKSQRTFRNERSSQVGLPMGGIGTGCICLNGQGGLVDFSIRNKPATSAAGYFDPAMAVLHIKGPGGVTRVVEGRIPPGRVYEHGLRGGGVINGNEGLPRFEESTFRGEYPFGHVSLRDPKVPLNVTVTGFNPFIPLDDKNSGIPCAIVEYTLANPTRKAVRYEFSFHMAHMAPPSKGDDGMLNTIMDDAGVLFHNQEHTHGAAFGQGSISIIGHKPLVKGMWFRGGWFDSLANLWRELSTGTFRPNAGSNRIDTAGRSGGSILLAGTLAPGQQATYPILITWYFPNVHEGIGAAKKDPGACGCGSACGAAESKPSNPPPLWRPWYVTQWKDAADVSAYVRANYRSLRDRTQAFHDALFGSTLPSYVLDAVSANLGILKSPTVLREESGNIWAWEGCGREGGCCHGSCTHVWNYAQALPHLFPQLERTLREAELLRSIDDRGHVNFRAALPDGEPPHDFHAAADGQLGGILKVYRDWQISGDDAWLARMYGPAKRSLDFCIGAWDPDHRGVVSEPHHNTYDIEFWGPDGMCSSIYVAALAALAQMARRVGHDNDAPFYEDLARKGAKCLDKELFNGQYFQQKVMYKELRDQSFAQKLAQAAEPMGEVMRLLKSQGPKYQYGSGCISDGVIGAWMAKLYGLETPQTAANVRKNLRSIFACNFRHDLSEHPCTQRGAYALNHEAGLLLCSWPRGGMPTLPFIYSDEVWTGIEYQVASHLIAEGMVREGLTIVKAARDRYDGVTRNPWNEYECGNYYARAMSSYALMGALGGVRYSAADKTLWLGPKLKLKEFRTFLCAAGGFGTISLAGGKVTIRMIEGQLDVRTVVLTASSKTRKIACEVLARAGQTCQVPIR